MIDRMAGFHRNLGNPLRTPGTNRINVRTLSVSSEQQAHPHFKWKQIVGT